jgi:hypothetical protein
VVTVVLVFVTATLALGAGYLFPLFGLIPVSVAIAVFKHRLYEIDRLINRTLVYGLLTALLGGVYAGLILLAGQLFGDLGDRPPSWAVAGATLSAELLGVVDQTVQPASASLWLRGR